MSQSEPEMFVSWCDDGVTVICTREACRTPEGYWWQEVISKWLLQPVDLLDAMSEHRRSHR